MGGSFTTEKNGRKKTERERKKTGVLDGLMSGGIFYNGKERKEENGKGTEKDWKAKTGVLIDQGRLHSFFCTSGYRPMYKKGVHL